MDTATKTEQISKVLRYTKYKIINTIVHQTQKDSTSAKCLFALYTVVRMHDVLLWRNK